MYKDNEYKPLVVFALMACLSVNIWAEKTDTVNIYDNCTKEAGTMNNTVVAGCSEMASESAKKEITRLYKIIYKNISDISKEDAIKFENSQKAWLKYRNSHCILMGSYVGSPMYYYCPMKLNESRAVELKELAEEFDI